MLKRRTFLVSSLAACAVPAQAATAAGLAGVLARYRDQGKAAPGIVAGVLDTLATPDCDGRYRRAGPARWTATRCSVSPR